MQSIQELESWYQNEDPWGYKTNPHDSYRKVRILDALKSKKYTKALDIGCGEGWITQHLPAKIIHGLELSEHATSRIPKPVIPVKGPSGKYDLITLMGVLYTQYDYKRMIELALKHIKKGGTILTCHIKDWEQQLPLTEDVVMEFPYREYTEVLRRYTCK